MLPLDFLEEDRGVTLRVAVLLLSSWGLARGVTGVLFVVGSRGAACLEDGVDVALPATRGVNSGVLAVLADASVGFSGRFVVRSEEDMAGVTSAVAAASAWLKWCEPSCVYSLPVVCSLALLLTSPPPPRPRYCMEHTKT